MVEPVLLRAGEVVRPFCELARVKPRGYSSALQRAMVDFGADESFARAARKLTEHYGIEVPVSAIRTLTQEHGQALAERESKGVISSAEKAAPVAQLIAEIDGSMVPIVDVEAPRAGAPVDGRKRRHLRRQEARLSLVHAPDVVNPLFGATLGTTDEAGDRLDSCARRAGFDAQTRVHGLGDGAVWIAEQFERVFGAQASFLVDFYHVCDYLAPAAKACASPPLDSSTWLEQQKQRLKEGRAEEVLASLQPHREDTGCPESQAPVRACHHYLSNRPGQFDYKAALEAELPIGSGEIESAHRYVIQQRLKIPGAWWKPDNAEKMLGLRVARANQQWEQYWQETAALAA